jgi:hypothetical protein
MLLMNKKVLQIAYYYNMNMYHILINSILRYYKLQIKQI